MCCWSAKNPPAFNPEGPGAERSSTRSGDGFAGEKILEQLDALASGGTDWTADLREIP